MPNIKPISDLRNYNEVLRDIAIEEASLKLMSQLGQGEQAGKEIGWVTIEEVEADLGFIL